MLCSVMLRMNVLGRNVLCGVAMLCAVLHSVEHVMLCFVRLRYLVFCCDVFVWLGYVVLCCASICRVVLCCIALC